MALPDYKKFSPDAESIAAKVSQLLPGGFRHRGAESLAAVVRELSRRSDAGAPTVARRRLSYILATALWETGRRGFPVYETFAPNANEAARRLEKAWKRGRLRWVKHPYWRADREGKRWLGRGLVQLTHRRNYAKYDDAARARRGRGLLDDPELAMDTEISAYILVNGMMSGKFTGHTLGKYISDTRYDYRSARKVVNPGDRSSYRKIEKLARKIERMIADEPHNSMLARVQKDLRDRGYSEVGTVDGVWGKFTETAILAFRNDRGLALKTDIDDAFLDELRRPSGRVVDAARAKATAADLREAGSTDIARADNLVATGAAVGGGAGILNVANSILPKAEQASGLLGRVAELSRQVTGIIQENAVLLLVVAGGAICYFAWQARKNRVEKHRTGEYRSR